MTHLLAECIDKGITLLAAVVLLTLYFKPGVKHLHKNTWVLAACAILVLYSVVGIGLACREHLKTRVPSKAELQRAMLASNTVVEADTLYRSPHGYSILIPEGYAYTEFKSGPLSMAAVREGSAVVVGRQPASGPLDSTVQDVCLYLKKKNPTYSFAAPEPAVVGKTPAILQRLHVTKNDVPMQSIFLFFEKNGQLFQVMCSCPEKSFEENRARYESVLASLVLD